MEVAIMQINLIEGLPIIFQVLIQMLIILVPTSIVGLVLYRRLSKFRTKVELKVEKQKYELREIRRVSKKATEYIYGLLDDINGYVTSSMVNDDINRQYEESISKKFYRLEGLIEFQSDRINERLDELWDELQILQADFAIAQELPLYYQSPEWHKSEKVLDVGCGNGHYLNLLNNYFPDKKYFGVDVSSELISIFEFREK